MGRDANVLLLASFLFSFNFNLMLPIAPIYASAHGSTSVAALINAVLLSGTVLLQWNAPLLLRRFTKKQLFVAGHVLLGIPGLAYALPITSDSVVAMFVATALRGAGFGIVTVVSAGLLMELVKRPDKARALGSFGMVTALPAIGAPPAGLMLMENFNAIWPVALTAVIGLLAVPLVASLNVPAHREAHLKTDAELPLAVIPRLLRDRTMRSLSLSLLLISVAWIGTMTFIPLTLPGAGLGSAATFLLVSGLFIAVGRWLSGWVEDRGAQLMPRFHWLVVLMALGLGLLVLDTWQWVVVVSAALYGLGLGLIQTVLFIEMVTRNPFGHSAASALWNTSIDLGGVFGTISLSALVATWGTQAALWAMPLLALASIPLLLSGRAGVRPDPA